MGSKILLYFSCDKYWQCEEGVAELKTCGNGLGFLDTDPTFTLEQCAELHLVECGAREELEPPISTQNCPRLYGTFADPTSCSVFWKCLDGKANRYECPPGLAYDTVGRGCKWADQVPECKNVVIEIEGEEEEFKCPARGAVGAFTKHAHPSDCRQYFVCIGGVPREYGCPLGTVFSIGSDEFSGKCTEPENVLECKDYYGDLEFDSSSLTRAGLDTGKISERSRSSPSSTSSRNSINRESSPPRVQTDSVRRRPAPPALQAIVDSSLNEVVDEPVEPVRTQFRPRPRPNRIRPGLPDREVEVEVSTEPATARPSRIQVLTDRPRTTFPRRQETTATTRPTTAFTASNRPTFAATNPPTSRPFTSVFNEPTSTVPRAPQTTTQPPQDAEEDIVDDVENGLPGPVKAAPGPNGEDYYYYYYYEGDYESDEQ